MPYLFNVTYDIVTQESAEYGDTAESGFISRDSKLRDAIADLFDTYGHNTGIECIEAAEAPLRDPCWITVYNSADYKTGAQESRSLHLPDNMTRASKLRLCRLLNVYRS